MAFIYLFTFPNGKHYVGFTTNNYKMRWRGHKHQANSGKNTKLYHAIRKYGFDNIKKEIIFEHEDASYTLSLEDSFITQYDSLINGYNSVAGGGLAPVLKGELNPGYRRKGKSMKEYFTEEQCSYISKLASLNHSGHKNRHARKIELTSPSGDVYNTHGNLQAFCNQHNIGFSLLFRYLQLGEVVPPPNNKSRIKEHNIERRNNTTGWFARYV